MIIDTQYYYKVAMMKSPQLPEQHDIVVTSPLLRHYKSNMLKRCEVP